MSRKLSINAGVATAPHNITVPQHMQHASATFEGQSVSQSQRGFSNVAHGSKAMSSANMQDQVNKRQKTSSHNAITKTSVVAAAAAVPTQTAKALGGGSSGSKAQAKTLTKRKLQEFDKANHRRDENAYSQKTKRFLNDHSEEEEEGDDAGSSRERFETLSEEGEEIVRQLISVIRRANLAAVFPPQQRGAFGGKAQGVKRVIQEAERSQKIA